MFTFKYNDEEFVLDNIANVWSLIGAASSHKFCFKNRLYKLGSYFEFEKIPEGICVSFCEDLVPSRRNLAHELMSSLLMTYSNVLRLGGLIIKTKVCGKAKRIFQNETHEEKVMFPQKIDISSFHHERYVVVDLPHKQAAKLLLAQEYHEPLVHPDFYTVKINPENIKSFIIK